MFFPFRSIVSLARRISTQSSVNPDEISHFSRLSTHWWDEHGEFEYLHKMNPVRMTFVRNKILEAARDDGAEPDASQVLAGLDVLDIGCGGGLMSEARTRCHVFHCHFRNSTFAASHRALRDSVQIPSASTRQKITSALLVSTPQMIHDLHLK
jgi:2-polyprenyl-3-methyl-5-hydroxy-6-metoxy-1,4-benzoquinol methylase